RRVLLVPPIGPDQPSSYRVSWLKETNESPRSGWIAFARTDGNALVVDQLQGGRTVAVLDHHSPVFGVAWAPFAEGSSPQLCTAAFDGVVRVWSISPTNGVARISHCLNGHEGKAFNVLPHPLLRDILASGGDDSTLGWQVPLQQQPLLRALVGTIRVWDVPTGCCIHVHCDHAADVYGLASHPSRPFLFISTSRDSTIKLSTTEWLCRLPVVCALFAEDPLAELASCIPTDDRDAILREFLDCSPEALPGKPVPYTSLYGSGSARLLERLRSRDRDPLSDAVDILSFFVYRRGVEDIADVIRGLLGVARQHDGPGEYVHEKDLEAACSSRAYNALAAATTTPSVVGIGAPRLQGARGHLSVMPQSRRSLSRAAELFLVNGDIRNYCETLARGRRWEAAIA
ncbi:Coronin-7, partial [Perkinsus olseni]